MIELPQRAAIHASEAVSDGAEAIEPAPTTRFTTQGSFPPVASEANAHEHDHGQTASQRAFGETDQGHAAASAGAIASRSPAEGASAAHGDETLLLFGVDGQYAGFYSPDVGVRRDGRPETLATRAGIIDANGSITATFALNDPAKDQSMMRLALHDREEIELWLQDSGVNREHGPIGKLKYAWDEGRFGRMDYMRHVYPQGTDVLHVIRGDGHAYNLFDFGNHMWGIGMRRLGVSRAMTVVGSQANALMFASLQYGGPTVQLDDPADQRAIKAGHASAMGATKPDQEVDAGTLEAIEHTESRPVDGGVEVRIVLSVSEGARYRRAAVRFPQVAEAHQPEPVYGVDAYADGKIAITHVLPESVVSADIKERGLLFVAVIEGCNKFYAADELGGSIPIHA